MLDDKNQGGLPSGLPQNKTENQFILLENIQSFEFFDKNEVAKNCQISVHTLQNWLGSLPAKDCQIRSESKGRKLYREDYLAKLFEKNGRLEDFKKLKNQNDLPDGLPPNLLESKNETIETLKNWNRELVNQVAYHQKENEILLEIINRNQKIELDKSENKKKANLLENLPKIINRKWWSWFLTIFNQNKPKQKPKDN